MTEVTGNLIHILNEPSQVAEVRVAVQEDRPAGTGIALDDTPKATYDRQTGVVAFDAIPGPAILLLKWVGETTSKQFQMIIPDTGPATLADCVRNAEMAGDRDVGELAGILEQIRGSVGASAEARAGAEAAAGKAEGHAEDAAASAGLAAGSADAARGHADEARVQAGVSSSYADSAGGHATSAAGSATAAATHEETARQHAEAAGEHEQAAGAHAQTASTASAGALEAADRIGTAEQVGVWHGETLEARDEAESARDVAVDAAEQATTGIPNEAVTRVKLAPEVRDELDGKAGTEHKHTSAEITDASHYTNGSSYAGRLVKFSDSDGQIHYGAAPNDPNHVANKKYVDQEVDKKADTEHMHVTADIADLPKISTLYSDYMSIVQRTRKGNVDVPATPTGPRNAASKGYVDREVDKKADKAHTHTAADVGARPDTWTPTAAQVGAATPAYVDERIQLVTSWPSSPVAGVLYLMEED